MTYVIGKFSYNQTKHCFLRKLKQVNFYNFRDIFECFRVLPFCRVGV